MREVQADRPQRLFHGFVRPMRGKPADSLLSGEKRLVTLPVEAPWLTLNYGFSAKRGRTLSPAAKAFMEIVREIERGIPQ